MNEIKKISNSTLFIIVLVLPIFSIFWNLIFKVKLLDPITNFSHGLITQTLIANVLNITFFSIFIFYFKKLGLNSVFINKEKMIQAIIFGIISWTFVVLFFIMYKLFHNSPIEINSFYLKEIGLAFGQLFGNAFFEELIFRGVLFIQFFLMISSKHSHKKSIILALIFSSLIFSLNHLPNRILNFNVSNILIDSILTFIIGCIFCLILYWSENLIHVVIIHSFLNYPLFIINIDNLPLNLLFCIIYIGIIFLQNIKFKNDY